MPTPTYDLRMIQQQLSSISKLRMTLVARQDAMAIGFSDQDVVDAIQALTPADFYKTMAPNSPHFTANHDVYRPNFNGLDLYIKFQLSANGQVVVSFKEK